MNDEIYLWKFAESRLRNNENLTLLVVAESSGSSPGRQGFKMIVARDELAGSIGGGVMEVALVELAKSKTQPEIIEQIHRKNSPHSSGMICSGEQKVIFFRLDKSHLKTIRKIIRALKNNQDSILQITNSELKISAPIEDFNFKFDNENDAFKYEEKLGFKQKLFIVGGGHCALALSELMSKTNFYISLFDDRADLNTIAKNKFVHEKTVVESYEKIGEFIPSGANHFVVVMTLGYKFDEIVIKNLLDKDFGYFGVLGSRAKMATLLRELKLQGFDAEKLDRIHTPIGLPINSRTPFEIAVSIAAEIITIKNANLH